MRVCISGGFDIDNTFNISDAIGLSKFHITRIIANNQVGACRQALIWSGKFRVKVQLFPIECRIYGKQAWVKNNQKMALFGNALILVCRCSMDERSRHLLRCFRQEKKPYYIYYVDDPLTLLQ